MTPEEAATRGQALARLAAGLAGDGDWTGAGLILADLTREELAEAVAELARMAIARDAEVFPQADKDKPELAPDWPAFWADAAIAARTERARARSRAAPRTASAGPPARDRRRTAAATPSSSCRSRSA